MHKCKESCSCLLDEEDMPDSACSSSEEPAFDYFENFRKYQQAKEQQEYMSARNAVLAKFESKYVKMSGGGGGGDGGDQSSSQNLRQMRVPIVHQSESMAFRAPAAALAPALEPRWQLHKNATVPENSEKSNDATNLNEKPSLHAISYLPVSCPIEHCPHILGITSVFSHLLRDHNSLQCYEILRNEKTLWQLDLDKLETRKNFPIGLLAYSGVCDNRFERPAIKGICVRHSFLPKSYEHLDTHLPIIIMACKTSWTCMLDDKAVEAEVTDCNNELQTLLLIWLVSVETTKPIHGLVHVYNKSMTSARTTTMNVRNLSDAQNPSQFARFDCNCLRLGSGDLKLLTDGGTQPIQLEVMVSE